MKSSQGRVQIAADRTGRRRSILANIRIVATLFSVLALVVLTGTVQAQGVSLVENFDGLNDGAMDGQNGWGQVNAGNFMNVGTAVNLDGKSLLATGGNGVSEVRKNTTGTLSSTLPTVLSFDAFAGGSAHNDFLGYGTDLRFRINGGCGCWGFIVPTTPSPGILLPTGEGVGVRTHFEIHYNPITETVAGFYDVGSGLTSAGTDNILFADMQSIASEVTILIDYRNASPEWDNINLRTTGPPQPPGTDFTWNTSESGNWVARDSWLGPSDYPGLTIDIGIPPASTPDRQSALFGDAIGSTSRTVFTDTSVSVNAIHFDNSAANYAIAGNGSVHLLASTRPVNPNPAINVAAGNSHQFQAIVGFHADGTVDIASGATLTFNNALNLNGKALTKTGEGTLAINNVLSSGGGTLNCSEGSCSGSGTIGGDVNNNGGTISPGNSPGVMAIEGSISVIPEPSSFALAAIGLVAVLTLIRRKK